MTFVQGYLFSWIPLFLLSRLVVFPLHCHLSLFCLPSLSPSLFHICLYRPWLQSILLLVPTCNPIWSSALQTVFLLRFYLYIYPLSRFSSCVSKKPYCSAVAAVGKSSTTVTTGCCCKAQHLQLSHSVMKLIRVSGPQSGLCCCQHVPGIATLQILQLWSHLNWWITLQGQFFFLPHPLSYSGDKTLEGSPSSYAKTYLLLTLKNHRMIWVVWDL